MSQSAPDTLRDAIHAYIKKRSLKDASVEALEGTARKFLRFVKLLTSMEARA